MGDFNFNNINWSTWKTNSNNINDKGNRFLETMKDCYFTQHVTKLTRVRGNNEPSLIDLVISNEEGMVGDVEVQSPLGKSDHAVLTFNLHCYSPCPNFIPPKYQFNRGNYEDMREEISSIDWQNILTPNKSVNQLWNTFRDIIVNSMSKHIPKSKPRKKNNKRFLTPLDQAAIKKIKKKHRAWTRYIESKSSDHYHKYCRLRSQVTQITRKARKEYEKTIADESKTNPKKFWKFAKDQTSTREGVGNLKVGNEIIEDDKEKATVLLNQFSSVFTHETLDTPFFPPKDVYEEDEDLTIEEDDVRKKLKDLNSNKSAGPDGIHPRIYKELHNQVAKPLAFIFNKSLSERKIPDDWRTAIVSPIFKKGNRQLPENFRPVSLTSIASKILESFVREHLISHMKRNNLLSPKQYGFLTGRSTVLQLLTALDQWTEFLDGNRRDGVDLIYTDFQKAFDKVSHKKLLLKLRGYGFNNRMCDWVTDFLNERKHQVCINGTLSDPADVTSGIPQGSVLGPVLFVLFINDLPDSVNSNVLLFADDTKVFNRISSNRDSEVLQQDINNLYLWSTTWQLPFHPGKCKVLHLGNNNSENIYHMDNTPLETSEMEKDLGVIIDDRLSFSPHIDKAIKKANSVMGIIRRTFKHLDICTFTKLYKSLVRPHLEYAVQVWHPHLKKDIRRVESVQRRATKQINNIKEKDYKDRLMELKLPTLLYRRIRGDMIEVFKILNGKYDKDTSNILPLLKDSQYRHSTRKNNMRLLKRPCRLDLRRASFTNRVVECWNSLPQHVISAQTVFAFESRLDKFWSKLVCKYDFDSALASERQYHALWLD